MGCMRRVVQQQPPTATDVLVSQCFTKALGGCADRALEQQLQLGQKHLTKAAALFLELVRLQVIELLLGGLQLGTGTAILTLEQRDDSGYVFQITALQQLLEKAAQLGDTDAGTLCLVQVAVEALFKLENVKCFPFCNSLAKVLVAAKQGILGVAHTTRGHRPGVE